MKIISVLVIPDNTVRCHRNLEEAKSQIKDEMHGGTLIFEDWDYSDDSIKGVMVYAGKPYDSRLSEVLIFKIQSRTLY